MDDVERDTTWLRETLNITSKQQLNRIRGASSILNAWAMHTINAAHRKRLRIVGKRLVKAVRVIQRAFRAYISRRDAMLERTMLKWVNWWTHLLTEDVRSAKRETVMNIKTSLQTAMVDCGLAAASDSTSPLGGGGGGASSPSRRGSLAPLAVAAAGHDTNTATTTTSAINSKPTSRRGSQVPSPAEGGLSPPQNRQRPQNIAFSTGLKDTTASPMMATPSRPAGGGGALSVNLKSEFVGILPPHTTAGEVIRLFESTLPVVDFPPGTVGVSSGGSTTPSLGALVPGGGMSPSASPLKLGGANPLSAANSPSTASLSTPTSVANPQNVVGHLLAEVDYYALFDTIMILYREYIYNKTLRRRQLAELEGLVKHNGAIVGEDLNDFFGLDYEKIKRERKAEAERRIRLLQRLLADGFEPSRDLLRERYLINLFCHRVRLMGVTLAGSSRHIVAFLIRVALRTKRLYRFRSAALAIAEASAASTVSSKGGSGRGNHHHAVSAAIGQWMEVPEWVTYRQFPEAASDPTMYMDEHSTRVNPPAPPLTAIALSATASGATTQASSPRGGTNSGVGSPTTPAPSIAATAGASAASPLATAFPASGASSPGGRKGFIAFADEPTADNNNALTNYQESKPYWKRRYVNLAPAGPKRPTRLPWCNRLRFYFELRNAETAVENENLRQAIASNATAAAIANANASALAKRQSLAATYNTAAIQARQEKQRRESMAIYRKKFFKKSVFDDDEDSDDPEVISRQEEEKKRKKRYSLAVHKTRSITSRSPSIHGGTNISRTTSITGGGGQKSGGTPNSTPSATPNATQLLPQPLGLGSGGGSGGADGAMVNSIDCDQSATMRPTLSHQTGAGDTTARPSTMNMIEATHANSGEVTATTNSSGNEARGDDDDSGGEAEAALGRILQRHSQQGRKSSTTSSQGGGGGGGGVGQPTPSGQQFLGENRGREYAGGEDDGEEEMYDEETLQRLQELEVGQQRLGNKTVSPEMTKYLNRHARIWGKPSVFEMKAVGRKHVAVTCKPRPAGSGVPQGTVFRPESPWGASTTYKRTPLLKAQTPSPGMMRTHPQQQQRSASVADSHRSHYLSGDMVADVDVSAGRRVSAGAARGGAGVGNFYSSASSPHRHSTASSAGGYSHDAALNPNSNVLGTSSSPLATQSPSSAQTHRTSSELARERHQKLFRHNNVFKNNNTSNVHGTSPSPSVIASAPTGALTPPSSSLHQSRYNDESTISLGNIALSGTVRSENGGGGGNSGRGGGGGTSPIKTHINTLTADVGNTFSHRYYAMGSLPHQQQGGGGHHNTPNNNGAGATNRSDDNTYYASYAHIHNSGGNSGRGNNSPNHSAGIGGTSPASASVGGLNNSPPLQPLIVDHHHSMAARTMPKPRGKSINGPVKIGGRTRLLGGGSSAGVLAYEQQQQQQMQQRASRSRYGDREPTNDERVHLNRADPVESVHTSSPHNSPFDHSGMGGGGVGGSTSFGGSTPSQGYHHQQQLPPPTPIVVASMKSSNSTTASHPLGSSRGTTPAASAASLHDPPQHQQDAFFPNDDDHADGTTDTTTPTDAAIPRSYVLQGAVSPSKLHRTASRQ